MKSKGGVCKQKKTNAKGRVPKLRFPEFRDAGEWEEKSLSSVLDYERPEKYIVAETNYQQDGIPVLTANKSFILGYTHERHGVFKDLPVIIFDDFTTDKKYVDFSFKVKSSAIKILRKKDRNSLKVIFELMNHINFKAKVHKRYYISEYQNLTINIPNFDEQQKIADCLSSLDELIVTHSQKLDLLKVYKKGLMQKLFPTVGETVPKQRFPEFRDAPAWEKKSLSLVLDYERPEKYIVTETNYQQSGIPVLTANKSFILGYTHERHGVFDDIPVIIFDDFTTDKKYVDFPFKVKSSAIKILRKKGRNSLKAIFEMMNHINFKATVHKRYYISEYQNLTISIPNPDEQQKIADCLSSIDELIAVQTKKVDSLKEHKKGLIQQLFPSAHEVYG